MAGQGNPTSFVDREIRMVLVGRTGAGKSATGNTIIGTGKWAKIFKSAINAMSVTKTCKQHSFKRFEYDLQLVDVPGFCDTSRSHEDIRQEVMKCVGMSSPGIHAILFIIRLGRIGEEDKTTLETFLQCFGEKAKRFVILVFTGKDDLEEDGATIDHYICDCPVKLKQFLYETSLRFMTVNNRGTNEEKEKFTKELIDMIKRMVDANGGQCYTNDMYEKCEGDLREAEKKEKLEGKRQKEFEDKTAALEEQLQRQCLQMQEMEKKFEEERKSREHKDEEQLKERLKDVELRQKEEGEKKYLEEEKKREAEQKEAKRRQMEDFERRKEELRLEEIRKQLREKIEEGNMGFIRTAWQSVKNVVSSLW